MAYDLEPFVVMVLFAMTLVLLAWMVIPALAAVYVLMVFRLIVLLFEPLWRKMPKSLPVPLVMMMFLTLLCEEQVRCVS